MNNTFERLKLRFSRALKVLKFSKYSLVLLLFSVTLLASVIGYWNEMFTDYFSRVGIDYLLISFFAFMILLSVFGADLKKDSIIIVTSIIGGVLIEAWGTQTQLWVYYTELPPYNQESRPPLWIIPAWPICCLAINRLYLVFNALILKDHDKYFKYAYWATSMFYVMVMYKYVFHVNEFFIAKLMWVLLFVTIISTKNYKIDFLILLAGALIGYFAEYWGTSRHCWVYYSNEVPPMEAVLGHSFASLGFYRLGSVLQWRNKKINTSVE